MLGKTHITAGIASALLITRPATIPEVVSAVIGGAIGGWIVDIDHNKKQDINTEKVFNGIITFLIIGAFIILDFLIGNGMCKYIVDNWGLNVWIGLGSFLILAFIGLMTNHRTFTHSLLGILSFSTSLYFFCRPAAIPFFIGYASHLLLDLFNKKGLQILFPFKWKPCLDICYSDKKANEILFWIFFTLSVGTGGFFFASAMMNSADSAQFASTLRNASFFGLGALQLYLILINLITFLGFEKSYREFWKEELAEDDKTIRIQLEFETWLLNVLVFLGGGVGMLLSLIIHLAYPSAYNGNWWSFCYTSIMFWFTVYCYVYNPFDFTTTDFIWSSMNHLIFAAYIVGINAISAFLFFKVRNKRFNERSIKHTLLWLIGALGGTLGAIPVVIATRHTEKYSYASFGFFLMLLSQIVFSMYMISVGIL